MSADLKARIDGLKTRISKAEGEPVAHFVATLLHSVTVAHIMHLKTRSFAQHMALGELYEGLDDLADSYAESYQGCYGLIANYPTTFTLPAQEPVDFVRGLKDYVAATRVSLPQESPLQNIVDEIAGLIDRSLYKLTFLA